MVSLWLPFCFLRGRRRILARAGDEGGTFRWGANAMLRTWWGQALVASRWSRGMYAAMKCLCFCYLGLELALMRGPVGWWGSWRRMYTP